MIATIEMTLRWLDDPSSVTQQELEEVYNESFDYFPSPQATAGRIAIKAAMDNDLILAEEFVNRYPTT